MSKPKYQEMAINVIKADKELQSRVATDLAVARNYSDSLVDGAIFPAITVFFDGKLNWLADGFTRLEAHKRAGRRSIIADVREGSRRDAVLYSVSANLTMGMHPTQEDREKGALMLLGDREFFCFSDTEIAKRSGASRARVTILRKAYCEKHGIEMPATIITFNRGRPTPFRVNRAGLSAASRRRIAGKSAPATTDCPVVSASKKGNTGQPWQAPGDAMNAQAAKPPGERFEQMVERGDMDRDGHLLLRRPEEPQLDNASGPTKPDSMECPACGHRFTVRD